MPRFHSTILMLFASAHFHAQQMHFQKTYGAPSIGYGNRGDITRTTDDGYALCSFTLDTISIVQKILLMKTNIDGWAEWSRIYFSPGDLYTNTFAEETAGGGYFVCTARETMNSEKRLLVLRTDEDGETMWARLFGQQENDVHVNEMRKAPDGFLITGSLLDGNMMRMYLLKMSSEGEIIFWKTFFPELPSQHCIGTCALPLTDGCAIAAGHSFGAGNDPEIVFIKTGAQGNILWSQSFKCSDNQPLALCRKPNGNILVTGRTSDFADNAYWDMYLLELDAQGNMLWGKTYGGDLYDEAFSVMWDSETATVWVLAEPESFGSHSKAGLLHTDAQGNVLMLRLYSEASEMTFPDGMERAPDGGFTIFGTRGGWDSMSKLWLVTTDSEGNAPCQQWDVEPQVNSMYYETSSQYYDNDFEGDDEYLITTFDEYFEETILCYEILEYNPDDDDDVSDDETDLPEAEDLPPVLSDPETLKLPGDLPAVNVVEEIQGSMDDIVVYIPNAFTPNGDGINEIWFPVVKPGTPCQLHIYNRWGDSIYYTDRIEKGWNGCVNNGSHFAPDDVYSYSISFITGFGIKEITQGHVVLIR